MSIQISIKGHSNNGRSKTIASYYNSQNVDMFNVLPNNMDDLTFYEIDNKFNNHYSVYVNISGSESTMHFDFINQSSTLSGAKYKVESFLNMIK